MRKLSLLVLVAACSACGSGSQVAHEPGPAALSNRATLSTSATYGGISYGEVYDDYGEVIGKVAGSGWVPITRDTNDADGAGDASRILGKPTVSEGLDKLTLRRYVKRQLAEIVACYEKELADHPQLAGTVTARFQITAAGVVRRSSATGLSGVDTCVAGVIREIEFPKRYDPDTVDVSYPFVFRPGGP